MRMCCLPGNLKAVLAGVCILLLAGCRTARQSISPEENFFTPLTALPGAVKTPPRIPTVTATRPQPAGSADSLSRSQREQERRIAALTEQLERLGAARSGARSDTLKPAPRTAPPAVAQKPVPPPAEHETLKAAEKLYASGEYRKTIQSCRDALGRDVAGGIEDQCYFLTGASHYRLKQFDLALVSLKKVLAAKSSSRRAEASFLMGLTYRQLGMRGRAAVMFEAALKESPDVNLARSIRQELDRLAKNR